MNNGLKLETYRMSIHEDINQGDVYYFDSQYDGSIYVATNISGTIKEIAYRLFQSFLKENPDGCVYYTTLIRMGPFSLEVINKLHFAVNLDWTAQIIPEPSFKFWEELNDEVARLMKLIVFS